MRRTFLDPEVQRRFARDGYVVVPYIDGAEVARAREIYERYHPRGGEGFQISPFLITVEERAAMIDELAFLRPALEAMLDDHRVYMTQFNLKWPGEESVFPLHQDWTHVDEEQHRSLTVWTALDDCSPELDNGVLHVVPGSQVLDFEHKGWETGPEWCEERATELGRLLVPLSVRAGEAVFFDSRLLHASSANRSGALRLVLVNAVAPREAQLIHTAGRPDGDVDLYLVDPDFWRSVDFQDFRASLVDRRVHGVRPRRRREPTPEELALLDGARPVRPLVPAGAARPPAPEGDHQGRPERVARVRRRLLAGWRRPAPPQDG